jgi:flagellar motor switch protein FliG
MVRSRASSGSEGAGLRKAAILLVSLDADAASKLLSQFEAAEQEKLAREIVRLENHPPLPEERDAVLREFAATCRSAQATDRGGLRSAQALETSLGRARFGFLKKADIQNVAAFIVDEHPQTIALILSYLPPVQAARLLEALPLAKQQEVVRRLASLGPTHPTVVSQVEKALESRLSSFAPPELQEVDGPAAAAAVLNQVSRATERGILEGLKSEAPELAEGIRRLMFTFEEALRVNDRGIQNVLKNIDTARLSLALKTATPELRDKFFRNMSQRAAERIKEEMELMGPVRVADVEAAQDAVVDEILRLEEAGEVAIEGRGGSEAVVL